MADDIEKAELVEAALSGYDRKCPECKQYFKFDPDNTWVVSRQTATAAEVSCCSYVCYMPHVDRLNQYKSKWSDWDDEDDESLQQDERWWR
jgi:hypothetical protein